MIIETSIPIDIRFPDKKYKPHAEMMKQLFEKIISSQKYKTKIEAIVEEVREDIREMFTPPSNIKEQ
jgi:hypothetical protein